MTIRIKGLITSLFFIAFIFLKGGLSAQCVTCYTTISNNSNYTVNSGQVYCIPSGFDYTGQITLNGGTLCNSGTVHNIIFNSGTLDNYGSYTKTGNIVVSNSGNVFVNTYAKSLINVTGNFEIQPVTVTNKFIFNLNGGATVLVGKDFTCNKGTLEINLNSPKETKFTSKNIFNIGKQLFIGSNAGLNLTIQKFSGFNVAGNVDFDGKYSKTINNYGELNFNKNFSVSGNGQNSGIFTLNNYGNFNVSSNVTMSYNNGSVVINNGNGQTFSIGKTYTQNKENVTFTNAGNLYATNDMLIEKGVFANKSSVIARDIEVKQASFVNSYRIDLKRDFLVSNVSGTLTNNGFLNIGRDFSNKGSVSLSQTSLLYTKNLYNLNNGDISGPLTNDSDNDKYAFIIITNTSDNNGNLRNYLNIIDETYTGSSQYALDNINNKPQLIQLPPVSFSKICSKYSILIVGTSSVCSGASATLTAVGLQTYVITIPFIGSITIVIPAVPLSGFTWQPGSMAGTTVVTTPLTSTTVYTATATFPPNCIVKKTFTVTVSNLTANAGLDRNIYPGGPTILGGVPAPLGGASPSGSAGSPPYTYSWTPNLALTPSNLVANPSSAVTTSTTYTLIVTDALGCKAKDVVIITVQNIEYVKPHRELDGSYYNSVNNKVYFTTDGDYSPVNLNYVVYDFARTGITGLPITSATLNNGDNRYELNVSSLASGYYVLELLNQKNEKLLLRFKK